MKLEYGKILDGDITQVVEEAVFVDVGASRKVVVPQKDIQQINGNQEVTIAVGETIPVFIYHAPDNGGNPLGSIAQALGIPSNGNHHTDKADPWAAFQEEHQVGDIIEGTVKTIKKYGAFVELTTGIDGLIHVSELEPGFTKSPWDVVDVGNNVEVEIIQIDPDKKQISLSLKYVEQPNPVTLN